MFSVATETR